MDPIHPWIDPSETRRMAERLMRPVREPVVAPDETGFDDSFVGFSDLPVTTPAEASPEGLTDSSADAEKRAMLRERYAAVAMFMIDSAGALIFHEGGYEAFHFIARDLANSIAKPKSVRVKVGASRVLEIIPIESENGFSLLGVVLPAPLPQDSVGQIRLHWLGAQ